MSAVFDLRIENFTFALTSGFMVIASSNYNHYTSDIIVAHISNFLNMVMFGFFLLFQDPAELNPATKFTYYVIAQCTAFISDVLMVYLLRRLSTLYNVRQDIFVERVSDAILGLSTLAILWFKVTACFWVHGKVYSVYYSFATEQSVLAYGTIYNLLILSFTILHLYLIFQETRNKQKTKEVFMLLFIRSAKTALYEFIMVTGYFIATLPPINQIPAIGQKVTNILYIAIKLQVYMLFFTRIKQQAVSTALGSKMGKSAKAEAN
ncbi:hypothetical protein BC833DRAFT_590781 [Globomyces pollinis-pini]|nr:hypothetical protein BC833DRAFT_590781 [Globomyces pollinis-pini]